MIEGVAKRVMHEGPPQIAPESPEQGMLQFPEVLERAAPLMSMFPHRHSLEYSRPKRANPLSVQKAAHLA